MMTRILETLKAMDPKRVAALALGPGVLAVAGDVAISHFAGREMANPAQLLPVTIAPAAALVLMASVHPRLHAVAGKLVRAAGIALALLGTVGTGFHVRAFLRLLAGVPLTWDTLQAALAAAPPIFAPGAFIGMGAIVWLIGNPALTIRFGAPAPAPRRTPALIAAAPALRKAA